MKTAITLSRPMLGITVLFLFLTIVGCRSRSSKTGCGGGGAGISCLITSEEVFNQTMIGQVWIFSNNLGDITTIEIEGAPTSDFIQPNCVVWHYTKNRARAYWQPAADGAELRFVICPQDDGSWLSVANLMHGNTSNSFNLAPWISTQNIEQTNTSSPAYLIIPASGTTQIKRRVSSYRNHNLQGIETFNSILNNPATIIHNGITWRTDSYVESTCVPFKNWCGDALISEQWENCDIDTWTQGENCVHEKWYFAPNLGLVRVELGNVGTGEGNIICAIDLGVRECYTVHDISFQRIQ